MAFDATKFLINYTDQAKAGQILPLIGREKELERLIHAIVRKDKNNPIVVGPPGIGKSALIMGLVSFMASENADPSMQLKEVVGLDVGALMLAAQTDEEYASLTKQVIQSIVDSDGQKILYLKDMSFLVYMDIAPENKDAAKFLKLALTSGKIHCLLEAETQNYVSSVEKDTAVLGCLQPLLLEEPTLA
ncbi:MAG: ATP-dependent Clp protease ATP-binding subunit, partial [Alphaproteobacteria bacterium]|nr:ATP-dependent Clp protease ATP-binding subunit [Alphaproteobacteria bacterium]